MDAISSMLWKKLHVAARATGRNKNAAFMDLFRRICSVLDIKAVFEIGAHSAEFSRAIATERPDVLIRALEANPYVYAQFRGIMPDGLQYLNMAVAQDTEPKQFHVLKSVTVGGEKVNQTRHNRVSSLKQRAWKGADYETVTCQCTTIDALHAENANPRSALWIDVEGASGDVLLGGEMSLENNVRAIMIEVEEVRIWEGQWLVDDVTRYLEKRNFVSVAQDYETETQYNKIFLAETAVDAGVMSAVEEYADSLLSTRAASVG